MVLSRVRLIRVKLVLVNLDPINDTYIHREQVTGRRTRIQWRLAASWNRGTDRMHACPGRVDVN